MVTGLLEVWSFHKLATRQFTVFSDHTNIPYQLLPLFASFASFFGPALLMVVLFVSISLKLLHH